MKPLIQSFIKQQINFPSSHAFWGLKGYPYHLGVWGHRNSQRSYRKMIGNQGTQFRVQLHGRKEKKREDYKRFMEGKTMKRRPGKLLKIPSSSDIWTHSSAMLWATCWQLIPQHRHKYTHASRNTYFWHVISSNLEALFLHLLHLSVIKAKKTTGDSLRPVNIAGINYIVSLPNATPDVGENRRENREKRHQPAGITTVERILVVF